MVIYLPLPPCADNNGENRLKRLFVFATLGLLAISASAQADPFAPFRVFEGHWQGPSSGKPGTGTTTREYRFTLNNHFLWQRDKSVYLTAGGKTFVHEDEGYFSYDTARKLVLWDQVHSEGLVTPAGSKLKLSNENRRVDKSAIDPLRA